MDVELYANAVVMRHELEKICGARRCIQRCGPVTPPDGCRAVCHAEGVRFDLGLVML